MKILKKISASLILIFFSFSLFSLRFAYGQKSTEIPNVNVKIKAPNEFKLTPNQPTLIYKEKHSVISFIIRPESLQKVISTLKKLNNRKLLEENRVKVNGYQGTLMLFENASYKEPMFEWNLVIGKSSTLIVAAIFPKKFKKQLKDPLKSSLLSIKWIDQGPYINFGSDLPEYSWNEEPTIPFSELVNHIKQEHIQVIIVEQETMATIYKIIKKDGSRYTSKGPPLGPETKELISKHGIELEVKKIEPTNELISDFISWVPVVFLMLSLYFF